MSKTLINLILLFLLAGCDNDSSIELGDDINSVEKKVTTRSNYDVLCVSSFQNILSASATECSDGSLSISGPRGDSARGGGSVLQLRLDMTPGSYEVCFSCHCGEHADKCENVYYNGDTSGSTPVLCDHNYTYLNFTDSRIMYMAEDNAFYTVHIHEVMPWREYFNLYIRRILTNGNYSGGDWSLYELTSDPTGSRIYDIPLPDYFDGNLYYKYEFRIISHDCQHGINCEHYWYTIFEMNAHEPVLFPILLNYTEVHGEKVPPII